MTDFPDLYTAVTYYMVNVCQLHIVCLAKSSVGLISNTNPVSIDLPHHFFKQ